MSSFYLVVSPASQASVVSLEFSEDRWPTLNIDLYGIALHVLVAHLTKQSFENVLADLTDLTPVPEGAEEADPWDETFWVATVHQLSEQYVKAITGIDDESLSDLASWGFTTEEFEHDREHATGFDEQAVAQALRDIRAFLVGAQGQDVLLYGST